MERTMGDWFYPHMCCRLSYCDTETQKKNTTIGDLP